MTEHQAWTVRLGQELQHFHDEGATDMDLARLEHQLMMAIQQIKFVRKCYNKPASQTEVSN